MNQAHDKKWNTVLGTGKSLSEALIFASTNPQYDNRLFIELQVQYIKITSSEQIVFCLCTQHVLPMFSPCSELAIFMYLTRNIMNNMSSYCGLFDAKISASDKDLPVRFMGILKPFVISKSKGCLKVNISNENW